MEWRGAKNRELTVRQHVQSRYHIISETQTTRQELLKEGILKGTPSGSWAATLILYQRGSVDVAATLVT
jgi:hypothetical protein